MAKAKEINLFDFSDVSDLPEDLQSKLYTDTTENAREYADIVIAASDAGLAELEINQIIAVAHRMGKEVPTQQTVRNYLNKAVKLGMIAKPSRQTYGPVDGATSTKAETIVSNDPVTSTDPVVAGDPLADL